MACLHPETFGRMVLMSSDDRYTPGRFFLPGPTEVHPEVLAAMVQPMMSHRSSDFETLFAQIQLGLRNIFRTTRPVYVATASGTGLMEAAIHAARPGRILCLVNGAFGERFSDIARSLGREVTEVGGDWDRPVSLNVVEDALKLDPYSALTVVHSETSTGIATSLEPLVKLAHNHDCAVLVDSVSGVGGMPVETDAWNLDFVLTASQKALALPPGLSFAVASKEFITQAANAVNRGRYFDLLDYEQFVRRNQTPTTPALPLLYATAAQMERIARETIEKRWERHRLMSERARQWVRELRTRVGHEGITAFGPDEAASHTVITVNIPSPLAADDIIEAVAERGFTIGSGIGRWRHSTLRIGHMGEHSLHELEQVLRAAGESIAEALGL